MNSFIPLKRALAAFVSASSSQATEAQLLRSSLKDKATPTCGTREAGGIQALGLILPHGRGWGSDSSNPCLSLLVLGSRRHPREPWLEIQPNISTPAASLTSPWPFSSSSRQSFPAVLTRHHTGRQEATLP